MTKILPILMALILCGCDNDTASAIALINISKELSEIKEILRSQANKK